MSNNKDRVRGTVESEKSEIVKHNVCKGNIEKVKGKHETYVEITRKHKSDIYGVRGESSRSS